MLAMTTERHKMFITIQGISGRGGECFKAYSVVMDDAVDRLLALCRSDLAVVRALGEAKTRTEGMNVIARHLKAATPDGEWIRECAAADLCRRVLYLMEPKRFKFEVYGWIG